MPKHTICPVPHCGAITNGGRCPQHRTSDEPRRVERRKRDGLTRSSWQRTRKIVLDQANHECARCGYIATHAHKITGGWHTTNPEDYTALCIRCHGRIHGGARGARVT